MIGTTAIAPATRRMNFKHWLLLIAVPLLTAACGNGNTRVEGSSSSIQFDDRIVNGVVTPESDLPYVVRVFIFSEEGNGLCTGSFITPTQVLTAAHCVTRDASFSVFHTGELADATNVRVFPDYNPSSQFGALGDLAIIDVATPYTGPLAILSSRAPLIGQSMLLAGYGTTGTNEVADAIFRTGRTPLEVVLEEEGVLAWAFDSPEESNTCFGDSGGPSFVQFAEEEPLQMVSLTSGGGPTCEEGSISLNTYLQKESHLSWIQEQTEGQALIYYTE